MPDLSWLNPQQRLAVESLRGPVLVLAGAGTGKTRVITYRVAHMIEQGIAPGQILAVTFTNRAAREMQERVHQLLPKPRQAETRMRLGPAGSRPSTLDPRPTICTFHSLGVRILRQHIHLLGYKGNFVIYNASDQVGAIRKLLSRISSKDEKADPAVVLNFLSRWKNGAFKPGAFADESAAALAGHICSRYEAVLRACNAVDFDDLLLLTLRLFAEHPEVLAACRDRFRYVLVDEYQDTNAAQFRLVQFLTQEHRNLCVVGDDDQSIYGWRGAEIANLLDLERHFPEVKVVRLEQNYRSTNTILQAANAVIKNNVRRRGKTLWSQKGQGRHIALHTYADDEAEARGIAEEIEFVRLARRVPWRAQAVLFRTNQQSRPLETSLRRAGVRYHVVGGQSYFDRREVKDFLAYLKLFFNPQDDVSLLRVANVPARGLSEATMERLLAASQEKRCPVFVAMQDAEVLGRLNARTREKIQGFVEFIERTRTALTGEATARLPQALQSWAGNFLDEIGYFDELRRGEKDAEAGETRVQNLKELLVTMDGKEGQGLTPAQRLEKFLDDLMLDTERDEEKETTGDAVTLITMHSCKGLEFPHVYIVGLEDGLLPHSRSKTEGTLDEERRLFYVALTRAQETLTLSCCLGRRKFGQVLPCHPSPFLQELPAHLVEIADEKASQPVGVDSGKNLFAAMRSALN